MIGTAAAEKQKPHVLLIIIHYVSSSRPGTFYAHLLVFPNNPGAEKREVICPRSPHYKVAGLSGHQGVALPTTLPCLGDAPFDLALCDQLGSLAHG